MTYAVLWSENSGLPCIGRLELERGCFRLAAREVSYDELTDVRIERRRGVRLAGRPTLVLERRDGSTLQIASFEGAGALHELAERLETARRTA